MPADPIQSLRGRAGAHKSWANTTNRAKRTAPARAALDAKFLAQAGGDAQRAEHLRKSHFAALALKSAQARRRVAALTAEADAADTELADYIKKVVDAAPLLTADQRDRLAILLRGGPDAAA